MKKLVTMLGTLAVALLLPFVAHAASFSVSPTADPVGLTCSGSANIYINTGGVPSNAANVFVSFDSTQISNVSISAGSFYSSYVDLVVSGNQARATGFSLSSPSTGSGLFARLNYTASVVGPVNFTILFAGAGNTLDSNIADAATSADLLTSVTNGTFTITTDECPQPPPPPPPPPPVDPSPPPPPVEPPTCEELGCLAECPSGGGTITKYVDGEPVVETVTETFTELIPIFTEIPAQCEPFVTELPIYIVEIPSSTVQTSRLTLDEPRFSAFNKRSELPERGSIVTTAERLLTNVEFPPGLFTGEMPREVQLIFGGTQYVATASETGGFEVAFVAPDNIGMYNAAAMYFFEDGKRESWPFTFEVVPQSIILGNFDPEMSDKIRVSLLDENGGVWDGTEFGQDNPLLVSPHDPYFTYLVPAGTYQVMVEAPGRGKLFSAPFFTTGFIKNDIVISKDFSLGATLENFNNNPNTFLNAVPWSLILFLFAILAMLAMLRFHANYLIALAFKLRSLRHHSFNVERVGLVKDLQTGEPVKGALYVIGNGTGNVGTRFGFSDWAGAFGMLLEHGKYSGIMSAPGYLLKQVSVKITANAGLFNQNMTLEPHPVLRLKSRTKLFLWNLLSVLLVCGLIVTILLLILQPGLLYGSLLLWYLYLNRLAHLLPINIEK